VYLIFYLIAAGALLVWFFRSNQIDTEVLIRHNWIRGLLGAAVVTVPLVKNVLSQPSTPRRTGPGFLLDLLWTGVVYGLVDALLLSVLPILAVTTAFSGAAWTVGWAGKLGLGALALLASAVVTAAYHLGYPEFRGPPVVGAVVGNGIMSLAYLITGNPLAAALPHVVMHLVALVHGRESTFQLPPHQGREAESGVDGHSGGPGSSPTVEGPGSSGGRAASPPPDRGGRGK
jgi:uncharacterized membrane protein YgcG